MKSHLRPHRTGGKRRASAFTLIELLIVIVIIAILAGVAFPVTAMVMDSARKAEAKNEVKNLTNAVAMYKMEYGKLPFRNAGGGDQEFVTDQDDIIGILSGYDIDGLNPREKVFYDGKRAKGGDTENPVGGTYGDDKDLKLVDPWGNPYYIKIDSNYDELLSDLPGMDGDDLRKSFAAWCEGKPTKEGGVAPERKWLKSWQ